MADSSDILASIDALTETPSGLVVPQADTTIRLNPVIPDGTRGWDAAEYGKRPASTSGVETMFSVRKTPWHELGVVIPEALQTSDIHTVLETAGMNWTVSKRPLRAAATKTITTLPVDDGDDILQTSFSDFDLETSEFFAMVRDDTNTVLGVVGRGYKEFQNEEALRFVDELLEQGATVETAGVLFGGKKIWLLVNIPHDMTIEGDIHVPYLLISTSHDGSGSVRVDLTLLRVECRNSLRWAIRNMDLLEALEAQGITNPSPSWTHRHSTNVSNKADEARKVLGFADKFLDAYTTEVEAMMAKVVSDAEFDKMVAEFLPMATDLTARQAGNVEEKRDKVRSLYAAETDGGKFKGTGWGAFQAFSSYDLWGADIREGEKNRPVRQMVRLMDGTIEKRSTQVRDRIMGDR